MKKSEKFKIYKIYIDIKENSIQRFIRSGGDSAFLFGGSMIKKEDKKLTEKQMKFLNEYIKNGDVRVSALKAGYSKNNAMKMGEENLKKENVRKYIKKVFGEGFIGDEVISNEKTDSKSISYKNKIEKDADCEKCLKEDRKIKSKKDLKDINSAGEAVSKKKDLAWDSEEKRCVHRFSGEKSFKENDSDDGEMIIEKKEKGPFTFDKEEKKDTEVYENAKIYKAEPKEEDEVSLKHLKDSLNINNEYNSDMENDMNLYEIKSEEYAEYKEDFNQELTDTYDKKHSIADEEEVMEYLTSLIRGSSATEKEKLKAAELMGKKYGMWSEKIDLSESGPKIIKVDIV